MGNLHDDADRAMLRVVSQSFLSPAVSVGSAFVIGMCVGVLFSLPAAIVVVRYGP